MPMLTNPPAAIETIYPGIAPSQYRFFTIDGITTLEWLSPDIEPDPQNWPTDAQLEAAEAAYQPASYLDGGEREPTVAELQANLLGAYYYLFWMAQKKIAATYALPQNNFFEIIRDPKTGQFTAEGRPEKAAKFSQVTGGNNRVKAQNLLNWESDVFDYLATRWSAIDPNGDFTGTGGIAPPTWASLDADIDANHPAP